MLRLVFSPARKRFPRQFGQMFGPVLGGLLNDQLGPRFIWIGGLAIGLASAWGLYRLSRRAQPILPPGP